MYVLKNHASQILALYTLSDNVDETSEAINKVGKIIKIYNNSGKILVKGINFKFKHIKPTTDNEVGEIKQIEAPIHHSNVKLHLLDS